MKFLAQASLIAENLQTSSKQQKNVNEKQKALSEQQNKGKEDKN